MMKNMEIGVYVGSFNPVHLGHIKIVNYLLDKYLDKVIIVPTGNYWHKNELIDIEKRIAMLKIFETNRILIDKKHNHLPYTYLIMEDLTEEYPKDTLYLILGADNLIQFDKWQNYKELLLYNFIIIARNHMKGKDYLEKLGKKDKYILIDNLNINISSTMIRDKIKKEDFCNLTKLMDKRVLKYIKQNHLYKGEENI